jgi:hypothetical protein
MMNGQRKCGTYIHNMEYYSARKKKMKFCHLQKMDGTGDHQAE